MDNDKNRAGKPYGVEGEEMLDVMDSHHTPISCWAFENIELKKDDVTLDIGCGSGLNVKRTHKISSDGKSFGVDYSSVSVKKSIETNKELIDLGAVKILEADAQKLPFDDDTFNVITAFETVYFWPNILDCFKEVKRILKDDGTFNIILECNGHYSSHLDELVEKENCKFYNDEELKRLLENAGYKNITVIIRKRLENKKIVKQYLTDSITENVLDGLFEMDLLKEDGLPLSPEWLCVIAQK